MHKSISSGVSACVSLRGARAGGRRITNAASRRMLGRVAGSSARVAHGNSRVRSAISAWLTDGHDAVLALRTPGPLGPRQHGGLPLPWLGSTAPRYISDGKRRLCRHPELQPFMNFFHIFDLAALCLGPVLQSLLS